jgi:hypothetical protein
MPAWYRLEADGNVLCINVHVQPNARTTEVAGRHGDAIKIRVAAPPVDARANQLLLDFIAEKLRVPRSAVGLRHGAKGRRKLIEVRAPGEDALRSLGDWDR